MSLRLSAVMCRLEAASTCSLAAAPADGALTELHGVERAVAVVANACEEPNIAPGGCFDLSLTGPR